MNRGEGDGQESPAVVLYGGKGGVGKTTCATVHALERDLDVEPTAVTDSLFALEVDPERGQEAYRLVVESLVDDFRDAGLRLADGDLERLFEAGVVPGDDEVAALASIACYAEADYDTDVFDTAPTGHTLRLLDLPQVLGETLGVAGAVGRRVRRTARAARNVVLGPAYTGAPMTEPTRSNHFVIKSARLMTCFAIRHTRFRVVLTPERMAILETDRLVSRLIRASIPIDPLVVNRVFLNDEGCPCDRCHPYASRHARRLEEIDDTFDRPVIPVPQLAGEAQGLDALSELGPYLTQRVEAERSWRIHRRRRISVKRIRCRPKSVERRAASALIGLVTTGCRVRL